MPDTTTIAAVSTPVGPGGISIVRVSGPEAGNLAGRLFHPKKSGFPLKSHRLTLGDLIDPDSGAVVDRVLCAFMKGPATYTREDVVEFHCHGGPVVAARVLELALNAGAQLARPGEFTRRAFLAGRIDLSQAEAVAELIGARGDSEARLAAAQLTGGLRARVEAMSRPLIDVLVHIEAALDFPDEEIEILDGKERGVDLERSVLKDLDELLGAYDNGRVFREGIKAAIVGRPNVGKSSLLNALVKADRAIVTPRPGTTRDVIEVEAAIEGVPITVVDTAGLESPPVDEAEEEGQRRAAAKLASADLALLVVDASGELTREDRRIADASPRGRTILVLNKTDLPARFSMERAAEFLGIDACTATSALDCRGLERLGRMIFEFATGRPRMEGAVPELAPNLRHKKALEKARPALVRALDGLKSGMAPELAALEVREALDALGEITGRTTPEDVLDEIFARFCLGK